MCPQRSLHNEILEIAITIVNVIRVLSKDLVSLLEWNMKWGGGKELLEPLLCMLSSIICTVTVLMIILINFSADVPSVFQLPSLLNVQNL